MKTKIYTYKGCSTCKKATLFLKEQGIAFEEFPIRDQPPTLDELKRMLKQVGGDLRKLFNTSGLDYRQLGLGKKFPGITEEEAFDLLSSNGNLVKRPFLLCGAKGSVGFKEADWKTLLAP